MIKKNHYVARGKIELVSGTCIGGSDERLQIGGTDITCIKDPSTGRPYIPGSSLKGKMRSALEKQWGKTSPDGIEPCGCAKQDCPVCRIFGPHKKTDHALGPTRIIVRDAQLIGELRPFESKTESVNRRDTGAAQHPRTVERVPPGAQFSFEIAIQEFDTDKDFSYPDPNGKSVKGRDALWAVVMHCLELIEQTGIGAGTSKGYGQIKITTDPIETVQRSRRAEFKGNPA